MTVSCHLGHPYLFKVVQRLHGDRFLLQAGQFHVPDAVVEIGSPGHQRNNFDVATGKDLVDTHVI